MTTKNQDFELTRGDDLDLEIVLTDADGEPFTPDAATWSLAAADGVPFVQKTLGDGIALSTALDGTVTAIVSIASADSSGLAALGRVYRHELEAIAGGKVSTVATGAVTLAADLRGALGTPPAGTIAISEVAGLAETLWIWRGAWTAAADPAYGANHAVSHLGSLWKAKTAPGSTEPGTDATKWEAILQPPTVIAISIGGFPDAAAPLPPIPFVSAVDFAAGLPGSRAVARAAATEEKVLSFTKNGVEFATLTFAPGETEGVFAGSAASFGASDDLDIVPPAVPDLTLADIGITLLGNT